MKARSAARTDDAAPLMRANPWRTGKVTTVLTDYTALVAYGDCEETVSVATHIPLLAPGQSVLVAAADDNGNPGLVIAAYPDVSMEPAQARQLPLFQYDATTGTLSIQANQLNLTGIGTVQLQSGEAVLRLNAQGELFAQAQAITQAAIGPYRIEGGSVDIN